MPSIFHRSSFALCAVLTIASARADKPAEMPEVVVTGTRTEKPLLETPVRTEVVNRKEIERTHARDLQEALRNVPGLLLKEIHGKSGFEAWLQGLDSDRVLVVIDGEPVTPSTGSTVDLSQIAVTDVERIEIVKGATSALYGSNAMGGVINVITRKPSTPAAWRLRLDGGSYGDKNLSGKETSIAARHLSGRFALKRDAGYAQIHGSLRGNDGYDLDRSTRRTEGDSGHKGNLDMRLAWTPDKDTEVYLAPRYYDEDLSVNFSTFAPGVGEVEKIKREDARRLHTTAGATRLLKDGGRLRGWLVYDNWRNVTQQDAIATPRIEQQRNAEIGLYRAEVQWDKPWGQRHLFTSGLLAGGEHLVQDKTENGVRAVEVDDKGKRNLEVYLQDDIFLTGRWELVPGLRIQNDSDFGFHAAPKLNAMYTPDWFDGVTANVRLGYGQGYRVPNLKERHYVFDHSGLGYMVLGNPGLQPESSDSLQAGVEFSRPGVFHAGIDLFHNRLRDFIDTDLNGQKTAAQGIQIFEYRNITRALTQGVETSARYRAGRFELKGAYTFLDTEDRNTGKTLPRRPRHQIKAGVDYEREDWGSVFTLRAVHQSSEFVDGQNLIESPPWTSWDMRLTQAVGKEFKIFGGINNLADTHRNPADSGDFRPRQGRFVYLGVLVEG